MNTITIIPFLNKVNSVIINPLIGLLFAVAFIYFTYGIVKFLSMDADGKSQSRNEAKSAILWGLIGMLIMFSVFGIIQFILATFKIDNNSGVNYIMSK